MKTEKIKANELKAENISHFQSNDNKTLRNPKPLKHYNKFFSKLKKILYFNSFFDQEDYYFGFGQERFTKVCEVKNCYTTNNKSLLGKPEKTFLFLFRNIFGWILEILLDSKRNGIIIYIIHVFTSKCKNKHSNCHI